MAYNAEAIFKRFGKYIKLWNEFKTSKTSYDTTLSEFVALFVSDSYDRTALNAIMQDLISFSSYMDSRKSSVESRCTAFIKDKIRTDLASVSSNEDDIIDDLILAMNQAGDKCYANTVGQTTPVLTLQNPMAGTFQLLSVGQMARNDTISITCSGQGTPGLESWSVKSKLLGTCNQVAETGEVFEWKAAGIQFRVNKGSILEQYGDDRGQLNNWALTGYTTSNTDKGKLYVKITSWSGYNYSGQIWIYLYKVDPTDEEFDATNDLVASGSRTGIGSVTLAAANSSGLSGSVNVVATYTSVDNDVWLRVPLFLNNDKITFQLFSNNDGRFFSFFRDVYDKELPVAHYYGVTITESWSQ